MTGPQLHNAEAQMQVLPNVATTEIKTTIDVVDDAVTKILPIKFPKELNWRPQTYMPSLRTMLPRLHLQNEVICCEVMQPH